MERPAVRLSLKSTKEEMLKAYNDLVARFQEKVANSSEKQMEAKKATEAAVVDKASSYTVESIIKGLANVNIYVGKALTGPFARVNGGSQQADRNSRSHRY